MEKKVITLSEFETLVEGIKTDVKRVVEVMQHGFSRVDERMDKMEVRMDRLDVRLDRIDVNVCSLKEQVALLHEGQTEIKNELKQKVDRDEFAKLEMRVARLESKAA